MKTKKYKKIQMFTKCPKKDKYCTPSIYFMTDKKNYICSGVSKKPTKFKDDVVWLCLSGALSKTALEMTYAETLGVISVLVASLFGIEKLKKETKQK